MSAATDKITRRHWLFFEAHRLWKLFYNSLLNAFHLPNRAAV